jgi:flagellar hook-associated protein 1 FlgK
MPTLQNALFIGLSGLQANQQGLNVTGHNVSNVNTEGYTRQKIILESNKPLIIQKGIFGTGVNVSKIARFRDAFIDRQVRAENHLLGDLEKQAESMQLIEGLLNEPSDLGLHNAIKNFFNSLQDLTTNPESSSVRTTVREQGRALARMFNQIWSQLERIRENKNFEIIDNVSKINVILQQVGDLNLQIASTEALGKEANDLRDKRDLLLDQLSKLVDMSANEDPANGSMTVSIAGQSFVVIGEVNQLEAFFENVEGKEMIKIINPATGSEIKISSGNLHGMLEIRDRLIPNLKDLIDLLASTFIEEVNQVHRQGYGLKGGKASPQTGIDFFEGTDAQTIALTSEIANDPGNIAASKSGAPGDNSNALEMAQLRNKGVLNNDSFTFEDFYGSLVSTLGLESESVQLQLSNQERLVEHVENFRESIIGVNLDEELVSMIRFQKAFGANARVITTVNELLGIVVLLGKY